jgi:monothiol glutaredoxin
MTLRDEIQQVIDGEPVAIFMKGTPERPACGNSLRALQALWNAGAPISAVDVLPDPRIRQELSALTDWPTIPQVFVNGELIGGADITEELFASGELGRKLDEALGAEREQVVKTVAVAEAAACAPATPTTTRGVADAPPGPRPAARGRVGDNRFLTARNPAFTATRI